MPKKKQNINSLNIYTMSYKISLTTKKKSSDGNVIYVKSKMHIMSTLSERFLPCFILCSFVH